MMDRIFTEKEIVKKKFIFVSYQHNDSEFVEADVDWFISQGVRVWYDSDLKYGDDWKKRVQGLLQHENCCGVFFYCSETAYISDAIYFEREIVLEEIAKRPENSYFYLPVNLYRQSTLQLLQTVLKNAPEGVAELEKHIDDKKIVQILSMFPVSKMYCFADQEKREEYLKKLMEKLNSDFPEVVDTNQSRLQMIGNIADIKKGVSFVPFGKWLGSKASVPGVFSTGINSKISYKGTEYILFKDNIYTAEKLMWLVLKTDGDRVILLSNSIVDKMVSDDMLYDWINGEFIDIAFSDEEKKLLCGKVRLLTEKDIESLEDNAVLAKPDNIGCDEALYWWIEGKALGNKQKVIKYSDGTVYSKGIIKNTPVGVRPVIEIEFENFNKYLEARNGKI